MLGVGCAINIAKEHCDDICTLVLPLAFIKAKDNSRDTRNNDTSPETFSNKTDRSAWVIDRQRQRFQNTPGSVTSKMLYCALQSTFMGNHLNHCSPKQN